MTNDGRPRGLGRGLSALLGEPLRPETTARPESPRSDAPPPRPAPTPPPAAAAPQPPAEPRLPAESRREPFANVTPLPTSAAAAAPRPAAPVIPPIPVSAAAAPPNRAAAPEGQGVAREIALERIIPNPNQPRRRFEEAELEDLARSIRQHGVLQPILVRLSGGEPNRYEIIAGERRWRAAQRAGLTTIPAIVRVADDVALLEIAIVENVQREDLNAIEEAAGYQALIERFGRTQQELADIVGKSRPHIANTLRLLNLPAEIQAMVVDGRLSAGHARALLNAPDPLALAQRVIEGGLSVREIEKLAARAREPAAEREAPPAKSEDLVALEGMLGHALGVGVVIAAKGEGGAGEIRLAYKNAAELDALCRRLRG